MFIVGAKGIGGYGGYETFVKKLLEYSPAPENGPALRYHIACKANGFGAADEKDLPGAERIDGETFSYRGALCHKIPVTEVGHAQAILYDYASARFALEYCRQHGITEPVLYILACRLGPVIRGIAREVHALGGRFILNPDGQDWRRAKWSRPVQAYLKYSESRMARCADLVVCDSREIEKTIRASYGLEAARTAYIAYGAESDRSCAPESEEACLSWLRARGLEPDGYYLMVCRFEPENSFDTILSEFRMSGVSRPLVIVTTENEAYRRKLDRTLHPWEDGRILLERPVYDEGLVRQLRRHAHGYIHGHQVGGTNPSLLEAMADSPVCLVRDVSFNRETAADTALYWTGERGSLSGLIDRVDDMPREELCRFGEKAAERVRTAYRWPDIAAQYVRLFAGEEGIHG